jgi:thioredoxin reductase (NADPH)
MAKPDVIRNASTSANNRETADGEVTNQEFDKKEIAIVGAGPIGLELAASFKRAGVKYQHLEARQIGYTISWWPRNTHFFSTTERIEIAGIPAQSTDQDRLTGEQYLAYLRGVVEQLDLQVNTYEPVCGIEPGEGGFILRTRPQTGARQYFFEKLILAIGDMHRPNLLGIPGEDLPHVSHYFTDPHRYFRTRLLIVGGRNSAVEAALRCWRAGCQVAISYRRGKFDPDIVKSHILPDVETQIRLGNIGFYPETVPVAITADHVLLESLRDGSRVLHPADFVLLATGFVPDLALFEMAGIQLTGDSLTPQFNPETMETNVPGLYVAGTAAAGIQSAVQDTEKSKYRLFIENTHEHVGKIVRQITGHWPEQLGAVPERQYELPLEEIQSN